MNPLDLHKGKNERKTSMYYCDRCYHFYDKDMCDNQTCSATKPEEENYTTISTVTLHSEDTFHDIEDWTIDDSSSEMIDELQENINTNLIRVISSEVVRT